MGKQGAQKLNRKDVYDLISIALIAVSVVFACTHFAPVFLRTLTSIKDAGISIAFYFTECINGLKGTVTPTVTEMPDGMTAILPEDWLTFSMRLETFFALLIDGENIGEYFVKVLDFLSVSAQYVTLCLPLILAFGLLVTLLYNAPNNDYNEDTKPLKWYKRFERRFYEPTRDFIKEYVEYVKDGVWIQNILKWLWLYNLNAVTIILEAVAFFFYFIIVWMSMPMQTVYTQFLKLMVDASVAIDFLPGFVWLIIGWIIFDKWRRKIGLATLRMHEAQNRDFIENHPGALFITGKQRAKKTTILVDMLLSIMSIHKERAKEGLSNRDMQFPNFPWINVELFTKAKLADGTFCAVAHIKRFYKLLKKLFYMQKTGKLSKANVKSARRKLKSQYGYRFDDFIFGYEWERYGIKFNDGLTMVDVFDAMENYSKLYYVYAAPKPLLMANLSIRTDTRRLDLGNFPLFDDDPFEVDPRDVESISEYCHILDYDGLRLGKTFDEKGARQLAIDVGGVGQTEEAKERLNQHTRSGMSSKSVECNQLNDLYEMEIKMHGHVATIDNYTYFQTVLDDQREGSLSGENADLCDKIMVKKVSDATIVMPFFEVEEALYLIVRKAFENFYYNQRHLRGDNTLLCYLFKKLYGVLRNHYVRVFNQFSVYKATIRVANGMTKEVLENNGTYWISTKKTYSDRFATDAIADFYYKKHVNAEKGINQVEQYTGKHATVEQMKASHSHFYKKLFEIFGDSLDGLSEEEIAVLEKAVARKYDHSRSWLKKVVKTVKDDEDKSA